METEGERSKHVMLQIDMQCRCMGCIRKIEKAMVSIGGFRGVETSVAHVDSGTVTVAGKVNPSELCHWLKKKMKRDVKIVYPDEPVQNIKQKMVLALGRSSQAENTHATPSAPPLQDHMFWDSVPSGVQSDHENLQLIEEKIRDLEKVRDALKFKNLKNELVAVKCELTQSREVINRSKKVLLDSALNQLQAYKKLETLSKSPCE